MIDETIYHPVSGEKGFFLSEKDAKILKVILADFQYSKLASIEHSILADGVDDNE